MILITTKKKQTALIGKVIFETARRCGRNLSIKEKNEIILKLTKKGGKRCKK